MAMFFIGIFLLLLSTPGLVSKNFINRALGWMVLAISLFFLFAGLLTFTLLNWLVLGFVIGASALAIYLYLRISFDAEDEAHRKRVGRQQCDQIWEDYRDLRQRLTPDQRREAERLYDACDAKGLHFYLEMQDVARVRPTLSVRG